MDPNWQRANIQSAASYLREVLARGADPRAKAAYEGLLDVLDPERRAARPQREPAAVPLQAARECRTTRERRAAERRRMSLRSPTGEERRRAERRTGRDRRTELR
jgi:hypothetical protein